jgi:hypothetical protein
MNIRTRISAILAGTAVLSSLAVGFGTQAASADNSCEVSPLREVYASDVSVNEGDPYGFGWFTAMTFTVHTFGCMSAASLVWVVGPTPDSELNDQAEYVDFYRPNNEHPKGLISWAYGESASKTFTVYIVRDTLPENDEALALRLYKRTGAVNTPPAIYARGWILDDDTPVPA